MSKHIAKKLLKEFQEKLLADAVNLKKQIEELKKSDPFADPDHATDNAAVDTDVREQVGHDTIEAEIKDLQRRLQDIEIAVQKIRKGKYGMCERCGKEIPLPRLKILSEARYCVDCEQKLRR